MKQRVDVPQSMRSALLIENQHACCICGSSGVQIHHINSRPDDNLSCNLAVLCLHHHDEATNITGLSAKLSPSEIRTYKKNWEQACLERMQRAARGRTAFAAVDYKNAERLRQLFSQLSKPEYEQAAMLLEKEFQEEDIERRQQGYDVSTEPTTSWNGNTQSLLQFVGKGTAHPAIFQDMKGHPKDPLFPGDAPNFTDPRIALYDIWCQIMARALIAVRTPYGLEDISKLDNLPDAALEGSLLSFEGRLRGTVHAPDKWQEKPLGRATLTVTLGGVSWRSRLTLKTHYVYSDTAAESLSNGRSNGLLLLRSIETPQLKSGKPVQEFDAIPLILGVGRLAL